MDTGQMGIVQWTLGRRALEDGHWADRHCAVDTVGRWALGRWALEMGTGQMGRWTMGRWALQGQMGIVQWTL